MNSDRYPDHTSMRAIRDVLPEFSAELERILVAAKRSDLASQVDPLVLVDRCRCGQSECAHFYTAARPAGAYGPGHKNLVLDTSGLVVLDLVDGRIVAVEVLDRHDVKEALDLALPLDGPESSGGAAR